MNAVSGGPPINPHTQTLHQYKTNTPTGKKDTGVCIQGKQLQRQS